MAGERGFNDYVTGISMKVPDSNSTLSYSISAASEQTAALDCDNALAYATVEVWVVQGPNPTAVIPVVDGAPGSVRIPPFQHRRIAISKKGNKLAFIGTTAGVLDITPNA